MVDNADAPDSIFKFGDYSLHHHAIYPVLGTELGLYVCQTGMPPAELHPQPCHLYKIAKMVLELLLKEQLYPSGVLPLASGGAAQWCTVVYAGKIPIISNKALKKIFKN